MTVTTELFQSAWLSWTGAETAFAPGFAAAAVDDVIVEFRDVADVVTVLTRGVHYSITLASGSNGVTVTPIALPVAPGELRMTRDTPALQAVNFANLGGYDAGTHTRLHDAAAMRDAELRGALAALVPGDPGPNPGVMSLNGRAGNLRAPSISGLRLTLLPGTPVMASDVANAPRVYATPSYTGGNFVPLWDGIDLVPVFFGEVSQLLSDTTRSPAAAVANANYDYYGYVDIAGLPQLSRSDYWKKSSVVTMTIATPCAVTWPNHNLRSGTPITFITGGALPGITGTTFAATLYVSSPTTNTFKLVAAAVNADNPAAELQTTGTQSGTHTATAGDDTGAVALGPGGNCEADYLTGIYLNRNNILNGPAAYRGTLLGSVRTDALGTVTWKLGGAAAGGDEALLSVCNIYNEVEVGAEVSDTGPNFTQTSATVGPFHGPLSSDGGVNGGLKNRISMLSRIQRDAVDVSLVGRVLTADAGSSNGAIGFAKNSTTAFDRKALALQTGLTGISPPIMTRKLYRPFLGWNFIQALQAGGGATAATIVASASEQALMLKTRM